MASSTEQDMTDEPWELLRHSGAMGEAFAKADWSGSPLGPPAQWPAALRANLALALGVPMPMYRLGPRTFDHLQRPRRRPDRRSSSPDAGCADP